ncbi:hypothetical protein, partial [Nocardia sp. NPDC059239]|uniref:hypothetical protein n=1 Tax=Nocardia sp. NPDC059239 TaxID=3346785 RepID=UPI0036CB4805
MLATIYSLACSLGHLGTLGVVELGAEQAGQSADVMLALNCRRLKGNTVQLRCSDGAFRLMGGLRVVFVVGAFGCPF